MIWKPSDKAICDRAARKSSIVKILRNRSKVIMDHLNPEDMENLFKKMRINRAVLLSCEDWRRNFCLDRVLIVDKVSEFQV